jgi:Putative phage metallopeptidase
MRTHRRATPPLILEWRRDAARLPRQPLATLRRPPTLPFGLSAPPHLPTGPVDQPFDFCGHIEALCRDLVKQCRELSHIDVSRVLFAVNKARNGRPHGLQARVTPLRFRGGELIRNYRGVQYQVQRFRVEGREILYIMTFCLPRFLNLEFDQKLITVFHELYHIGPDFDGDLRRHRGRYQVHTHSKRQYDEQMAHVARQYLSGCAQPDLHAFLRLNFAQLQEKHGQVIGVVVPRPKLLAVGCASAARNQ